jgi:hypothetical protein
MKKLLVRTGIAGALFAGTVLAMLAAQGRLNHEGTQGIPLLSSFFPAPPHDEGKTHADGAQDSAHAADEHAPPARSTGLGKEEELPYRQGTSVRQTAEAPKGGHGGGKAEHGADAKPADKAHGEPVHQEASGDAHQASGDAHDKAGNHAAAESPADWKAKIDTVLGQGQYRPGRLWNFPQMEAGMTPDELNEILRRARQERSAIDHDRSVLLQQRRELEARERDVADRQDAVLEKLREVEQLRAKLQAEIDEFHSTVLLIRQDEVSGLQAVAKTLAGVEAKSAAAVIKKWWETDEGQTRALKIWSVMDPDAGQAILAEMDIEMIRQVLEKRLKVVREQGKTKR